MELLHWSETSENWFGQPLLVNFCSKRDEKKFFELFYKKINVHHHIMHIEKKISGRDRKKSIIRQKVHFRVFAGFCAHCKLCVEFAWKRAKVHQKDLMRQFLGKKFRIFHSCFYVKYSLTFAVNGAISTHFETSRNLRET